MNVTIKIIAVCYYILEDYAPNKMQKKKKFQISKLSTFHFSFWVSCVSIDIQKSRLIMDYGDIKCGTYFSPKLHASQFHMLGKSHPQCVCLLDASLGKISCLS